MKDDSDKRMIEEGRELAKQATLRILIFGPGPSGGALYNKRCEIRDKLISLGHHAEFCEDIWDRDSLRSSGLNLAVAELIQALAYDYIICLMVSPGSIGEVHDFAKTKSIACKMMVCVDGAHKDGYSAQGVIRICEGYNGKIVWFSNPQDLEHCHLAGRVIEQITFVAEAKQWEILNSSPEI
jgi:hypothetical protein